MFIIIKRKPQNVLATTYKTLATLPTQKQFSHKDLEPTMQPIKYGCYVLAFDDFPVLI